MPMLTMRLSDEEQARLRTKADAAGLTVAALIRRAVLEEPPLQVKADLSQELSEARARIEEQAIEVSEQAQEIVRLKRELAKARAVPSKDRTDIIHVATPLLDRMAGLSRAEQHAAQDEVAREQAARDVVLRKAFPQRKGRGD